MASRKRALAAAVPGRGEIADILGFFRRELEPRSVRIEEGDILLAYSDGVIEAKAPDEIDEEGEIIIAGNGRMGEDGKLLPMDVKVGDRILFSKYGGTDVKIDGNDYLILRQDDVLGVIE